MNENTKIIKKINFLLENILNNTPIDTKELFTSNESSLYKDTLELLNRISEKNIFEESRVELAFNATNDGLWDWNLLDNSVYFSKSWKRLIGYEDNELENSFLTWQDRIHPEDLEKTLEDIQEHIEGKTENFENYHRLKHKDGSWIWILSRAKILFDKSGKAYRLVGTHTDATKEKKVSSSLKNIVDLQHKEVVKSNALFKTIFEQTLDGIAVLDLNSNFLLTNNSYQEMTGFSEEELKQRSILDIIVPEFKEQTIKAFKGVQDEGFYGSFEKSFYAKNNRKIDVVSDLILMPEKDTILVITKDITLKNRYKREKKHQENYLIHRARLAQMGEMIGNIAHQWRQPLNSLGLIIQKISLYHNNGLLDDEKITSSIDKSMNIIESMSDTIDDFREFFKPNREKEVFSLHDAIHKSYDIINPSFNQIAILCEFNIDEDISVLGYQNEFSQVVLNILNNAKDALVKNEVKEPHIKINTVKDGDNAIIEISDNAGGIPDFAINKVFNPYFSTKGKEKGTGIGLYMSKMIIEDHMNGELKVENRDDGACFSIHLKIV